MPLNHPKDALLPGVCLGRYEILRVLGRGGFGITYAARASSRTGEMVAIKELFPNQLCVRDHGGHVAAAPGTDESDLEAIITMFRQEAEIICAIRHPHLVRGIEWIETNSTGYLVMDYASGRNLQEHLRTSGGNYQVTPETVTQLCRGVLSGLDCLHSHGILHGDLKPDNIFLGVGFEPIIIDMGSARASASSAEQLPSTYSHHYSAIEQLESRYGRTGPWTDIYQLSAVIYRCLSGGKLPDAEDRARTAVDPFVRLTELEGLEAYPLAFLMAVDAGLERFPKDRPQSILQWRKMLDPSLETMVPGTKSKKRIFPPLRVPPAFRRSARLPGSPVLPVSQKGSAVDPLAFLGIVLVIFVAVIVLFLLAGC